MNGYLRRKAFPVEARRPGHRRGGDDRAGINRDVGPVVHRHPFAPTALREGISLAAVKAAGRYHPRTTAPRLAFTGVHIQDEFERGW
jgi:hypothetical protein